MQELTTFLSNHMALTYALAIVLVLLMIIEFFRLKRHAFRVNTSQAIQLINREHAVILDIRSPDLFQKGHIIDAQLLTSKEILENPKKIERFKNKPIILVCSTGNESQKVTLSLIKQGYNVYLLSGGIRAWTEAALPLVKE
jgi:rhodanese-related sulfurtransferase